MSVCVTLDLYFAMDEGMTAKNMNKNNKNKKTLMIKRNKKMMITKMTTTAMTTMLMTRGWRFYSCNFVSFKKASR
jgi:hypothetical protein